MAQQIVAGQRYRAEAAYGEQRTIHRKRRNHNVDPRTVQQARIHHGRRLIDAPANRGDNLVDDVHQVGLVLEDDVGLLDHAAPFHVDRLVGVHQDVADRGIVQQRLQGAEAEYLVQNVLCQPVAVQSAQRGALLANQLQNHAKQALPPANLVGLHGRQFFKVHATDQFVMHRSLQRVTRVLAQHRGYPHLGGNQGKDRRSHVHRYFCHCNRLVASVDRSRFR